MRLACAAALLACLAAGGGAAQQVELTAEQMRLFGTAAIARGVGEQALAIAEALLQRDPQDSAALTLKAQALREMGDLAGSEAAARAGWAEAATPANRFSAATALAQALSLQGHRTKAQYWLRQAVQNAPNDSARAQATQDFAYVRSQNPLHLQFDASFRPSNNVNNGTRDTLLGYLFGTPLHLPPEFSPLSGYVAGIGLSGDYRLGQTAKTQDALIFALNAQGVILSQKARTAAPAADAGNYAFEQIEAGWRHKVVLSIGILTTELTAGHNWYGGKDLSNILAAQAVLEKGLADDRVLTLTSGLTRTDRIDRPVSSATGLTLQADYRFGYATGQVWQAGLSLTRNISDDPGVDSRAGGLDLTWAAASPVFGLGLGATAGVTVTEYRNSRRNTHLSLDLTAKVKKVSYLGFSPVVSVDYSQNTSNFSYNNTEAYGIGMRLKSNF